jgi:hypothetical protein
LYFDAGSELAGEITIKDATTITGKLGYHPLTNLSLISGSRIFLHGTRRTRTRTTHTHHTLAHAHAPPHTHHRTRITAPRLISLIRPVVDVSRPGAR